MTSTESSSVANHAVVIGGSIAGLLAARVLSETFPHVTILDRDELPTRPEHRKGVPHGRHTHGLLAMGYQIFEDLLPGIGADLIADGAVPADLQNDVIWYNEGHLLRRTTSDVGGLLASRPLIEAAIRSRVAALPGVEIRTGVQVTGLTAERGHITGVRLAGAETLPARLVVDCTGRGNRGPAWLAELGYAAPPEDVVKAGLIYSTREYERVPGAQDFLGVIVGHRPGNPYGAGCLAREGGRWLVTLVGLDDDPPPIEPGAFEAYAARLDGHELHRMINEAEPVTDPIRFRIGPSVRRRYERCARLPEGFIALGDSLCCFNPAYGQGMTTAAMSARWLATCLKAGSVSEGSDLTRRYFKGVARVVDVAWNITVGNDLRFPQVEGPRTAKVKVLNRYLSRLHRVAAEDTAVGAAFLTVANFLAGPERLVSPGVMWRVLRGTDGRRTRASGARQAAPVQHAAQVDDRQRA
ncbi:tryptophan 7-halogenase [Streptosporangiaceae bacterium NEAU-GS5]|nr:tryptophan 7-halogenase [Streptosporangiaceae bacterium NEAU-GS5]